MAWTNPPLVATEDWKSHQGAEPTPALADTLVVFSPNIGKISDCRFIRTQAIQPCRSANDGTLKKIEERLFENK